MSSIIKANVISEVTSANGVSIDGVTIKDSQVPASAGSSMVLINKATASNSTSIEFKDGVGGVVMDSTYSNYIFQMTNLLPYQDSVAFVSNFLRGSSVSASCRGVLIKGRTDAYAGGSTTDVGAVYSTGGLFTCDVVTNDTAHKLTGVSGTMTVPNPSATNVYKSATGQLVVVRNGDYMDCILFSGLDASALTAIDGVKFNFGSNSIASGTISMYGLKDA
tara:strand:+ start:12075 stop:12734 length:660 start_codon:yes stop_codon:yes gene_type:complete